MNGRNGRSAVSFKQVVFDYSGIVAIAAFAVGFGVLQNTVDSLKEEVRLLRIDKEARMQRDILMAEKTATKEDVQKIADQLTQVIIEIRSGRGLNK